MQITQIEKDHQGHIWNTAKLGLLTQFNKGGYTSKDGQCLITRIKESFEYMG